MEYSKLFVALCCLSSFPAFAQIEWHTSQGDLKLYGDVEFNIDASRRKHSSTSLKTTADSNANRDKRWDINGGRVHIDLDGAMEQQWALIPRAIGINHQII